LGEIYRALVAGEPAKLPELSWTYADFAVDQRERASDGRLDEGVKYWVDRLKGSTPTELPSLVERPSMWCSDGATQQFELDAEVVLRLQEVAKAHRASMFMVLLAGFFLSLHEMTGETDLVVGSPTAGRDRPETAEVIGFFVNTLPLRVRLDPASSFADFLTQVRERCLEAYTYAEVPFDTIVNAVNPQRDLSRNPIFQIMFDLDEAGPSDAEAQVIEFEEEEIAGLARLDLQAIAVLQGDSMRFEFMVATAVCDPIEATKLAERFCEILARISET
jgi:non-ribosomal peptide synthetase component F